MDAKLELSARIVGFKTLADDDADAKLVIGRVRGLISTEDMNCYGFRIKNDAFDDSFPDLMEYPQLLHNHNWDRQTGAIRKVWRDDDGVWMEADIANTELGREVWTLISLGGLKAFSVGADPIESSYDRETEEEWVLRAELKEVSIVGRPGNKGVKFEYVNVSAERRADVASKARDEAELMEAAAALGMAASALSAITLSGLPR